MRDERRRVNLSLSRSSPQQRQAWALLSAIPPGQRTDAICRMVCGYREQEALLDTVRAAIREELQGRMFERQEHMQPEQAGDVDENVLGFLLSLQDDGGEDT